MTIIEWYRNLNANVCTLHSLSAPVSMQLFIHFNYGQFSFAFVVDRSAICTPIKNRNNKCAGVVCLKFSQLFR